MAKRRKKGIVSVIPLIKWGVRASLPFAELFLIGWIVWFAFHTEGLAKETQNLLSAIVGGANCQLYQDVRVYILS